MFRCRHCIYQDRGESFQNRSWFGPGAPERERAKPAWRRQNSSGLRPTAAGLASPGGGRPPQAPAGSPSWARDSSCSPGLPTEGCAEAGLGKRQGAGFRARTPSGLPRFLFEVAKERGANEAGEEVRKSTEGADNTGVTLPLPPRRAAAARLGRG